MPKAWMSTKLVCKNCKVETVDGGGYKTEEEQKEYSENGFLLVNTHYDCKCGDVFGQKMADAFYTQEEKDDAKILREKDVL